MAWVDISLNELRDDVLARDVEEEIQEAAGPVPDRGTGQLGIVVLDEGTLVDLELQATGWVQRRSLPAPPRRGDVRRAVQEMLESVGLL